MILVRLLIHAITDLKGQSQYAFLLVTRGVVERTKIQSLRTLPFYPLLFAIHPVLALLGSNVNEVDSVVLWRPMAVLAANAFIVMTLLRFLFRDWHRAAITTSILLLLFFTYGHIYNYLKTVRMAEFVLGRHRLLMPLWIGLAAFGCWWVTRKLRNPRLLAPMLNFIAIFLLIYPALQIISFIWSEDHARKTAEHASQEMAMQLPLGYAPDIYYLILDGYGREDVLGSVYGYNNSSFLSNLEKMGFYVAKCSCSNYSQTMLSLPSSLNMNYLDELGIELRTGSRNFSALKPLGQENAVRLYLENHGYHTVSFETNFPVSEWEDADYYLAPPPEGLNNFELLMVGNTAGRVYLDLFSDPPEEKSATWYRVRTLFALQQLEEKVLAIPGPKFVFAHLVIPHHPFVFGPNGEPIQPIFYEPSEMEFSMYRKGYIDQVIFINKRIEKLVRMILDGSSRPPIIIIQGDHGPAPWGVRENRMYILNAYYFPRGPSGLYESITPVNTFRLIFNEYFGANHQLLVDVSRFSKYADPFDFTIMPNSCEY